MRRGLSARSAKQEIRTDLGTYIYLAASTTLVFALFGGVVGHLADRLALLATTDPLTGLFNPRAFQERLSQELRRAARYQEPIALLIADLDGLKRVNDQYGHGEGDAAIRSVAAAMRRELRNIDVGARLGGDEFGVLTPRTNEQSAVVLAERLRARVVKEMNRRGDRGATISIGIASIEPSGHEGATPVSLMKAADDTLYRAKREGGNRVAAAHSHPDAS